LSPTAPPPTPEAIAKEEIKLLLESYRGAYEMGDLNGIRAVYPGAPASHLNRVTGLRSFRYTYTAAPEFVSLDPALGTATVKITALQTADDPDPRKQTLTLKLVRRDGRWMISDLSSSPK
jgi:hypothetical protein